MSHEFTKALSSVARAPRMGHGEKLALGSAVTFAIANAVTRIGAVEGDPIAGSVLRALPLALFSLTVVALRYGTKGQKRFLDRRSLGWLAVQSLLVSPLAQLTLILSLRYGGVLVAVPLFSTFPLFAALIAVRFLGESLNRGIGIGILGGVFGIALVSYGQHTGIAFSTQWPLGVAFGLLTALVWGLSSNLSGYLLRRGMNVFTLLAVSTSSACVVLALALGFTGRGEMPFVFSRPGYTSLILSGFLTGVAQLLLFSSFARTTVASASAIKTLDVVIAATIAVAFLGEVINLVVALGIALTVGGVLLVQLSKEPIPGDDALKRGVGEIELPHPG